MVSRLYAASTAAQVGGACGLLPEPNTISPFWSSSAVTGIRASAPQKVVREEAQSANRPRITANNATFSRCAKYRMDDFVAG
jgi:hypothetical protein